ncbi:MAG: helix-turn-helix transcriptional regulator [Christensenellaceae bacterium]|nr:helix-turn-helix transcriptional regulator [Christensenellaceae bacterium]
MRIRALREEANILQADLAKHLGVSQATLSNWERGEYQPDTETLKRIADYFDVSLDYLLGRSDVRRPGEVAAASSGVPYEDLPPEVLEKVEAYKRFLLEEYRKSKNE